MVQEPTPTPITSSITGASSITSSDDGKYDVAPGHWLIPVHSEDGRSSHLQLLPSASLTTLRDNIAKSFILPPHRAHRLKLQLIEKNASNPLLRGGMRELASSSSDGGDDMTLEEAGIGDGHRCTIIVTNAATLSSKKYYTGYYALKKLLEK